MEVAFTCEYAVMRDGWFCRCSVACAERFLIDGHIVEPDIHGFLDVSRAHGRTRCTVL